MKKVKTHTWKWQNLQTLENGRKAHFENGIIYHQLKMLEKDKCKIKYYFTNGNWKKVYNWKMLE